MRSQSAPADVVRHLADLLLRHRTTRWLLAWLAALLCTVIASEAAWTAYDDPERHDGNFGHATMDFGGQWLMGRLLVTGNGDHLYNRIAQRRLLEEAYPVVDGRPLPYATDLSRLLYWHMGEDDPAAAAMLGGYLAPLAARDPLVLAGQLEAGSRLWQPIGRQLGGPLYPPLNAYLYAPLGLLPPRPAYRLTQGINLALTFACGLLVQQLTAGRVWWPVAIAWLVTFPGYSGALALAQNSILSSYILMLGWRQLQLGRSSAAGIVWGFLAFKPVWAAAFLLVSLLTQRWKMAAAMVLTGIALALATVPLVGVHSWLDWLAVGSLAAENYGRCETWIVLSRDLFGLPRRWLLTFIEGYASAADPNAILATGLGAGSWLMVMTVAVVVVQRRGKSWAAALDGAPAAFILLSAWLLCYHFIYYDVLLAALPVCLLYAEPLRLWQFLISRAEPWHAVLRPCLVTALLVVLNWAPYQAMQYDPSFHFLPWDLFCLAALWAWCAVARPVSLSEAAQVGQRGPDVSGSHEGLSHEDGPHSGRL